MTDTLAAPHRATLRAWMGDEPHIDITRALARTFGLVRPHDAHRGPVRITRAMLDDRPITTIDDDRIWHDPPPTPEQSIAAEVNAALVQLQYAGNPRLGAGLRSLCLEHAKAILAELHAALMAT